MAKKVFKGVGKLASGAVGAILGGKKKKKSAEPVEGQPIITPLAAEDPKRRLRQRIASQPLGSSILDGYSGTLGG